MYIAITLRYYELNKIDAFLISKNIKDIFDKLNITLIPIVQTNNLDKIVELCDGLIITGSPLHVNPKHYNGDDIKQVYNEDDIDYKLISMFHKQNKLIIGICRGIQILNVYFGGTLKKDILNHEGLNHSVNINNNTFLSDIYNKNTILVNSTHTQAIDKLASLFKVSAYSQDNIIEAIEYKNIYAVQWHPEHLHDYKFFDYIIKNKL